MIRFLIALLLPLACLGQSTEVGPVGNTPQKIDTLAGLWNRPGTNSQMLVVLGHSSVGDWGGQRNAVFEAASTQATNLGCVFEAPGGRWKFPDCETGELKAEWFGAQPYFALVGNESPTNHVACSEAIQSATDYLTANGGGVIKFAAGTYWIDTPVDVKPRVKYKGASSANTLYAFRDGTDETIRLAGITYLEGSTLANEGFPLFKLRGTVNYTNMYSKSYVNDKGETITYHESGGNEFDSLVFTCYKWGWGTTNSAPVSGIMIDQVAAVTVANCGFVNIAGTGLWAHGTVNLVVRQCYFQNCLIESLFYAYGSDSLFENNTMGVGSLVLYRANSHVVQNNQIWNPDQSLLNYSGANSVTNIDEYGFTRTYAVERVISSDASDDTFYSATLFGADTGMLVYFTGTDVPAPFSTNTPYFGVMVQGDTYRLRLAETPLKALANDYIDIATSSTNGSWHLTGTDACVYVYDCEEVMVRGNRLDQSFHHNIELHLARRCKVDDNEMWDMGVNMGPSRKNLYMGHSTEFYGVWLDRCDFVKVQGNLFNASYSGDSQVASRPKNRTYGIYTSSSSDCVSSGNSFDRVWSGLYSDAQSVNIRSVGDVKSLNVPRVADSSVTNGMNSRIWSGIQLIDTNVVQSTGWPTYLTNLTDFTVAINFSAADYVNEGPANQYYDPILTIGSTTNILSGFDSYGFGISRYYPDPFLTGLTNNYLLVNLQGDVNTNYIRFESTILSEEYVRGTPIDLVVSRTGSNWLFRLNGRIVTGPFNTTGLGVAEDQAIHAKYLTLGYWPGPQYRHGWIGNVAVYNRGFTDLELYLDRFKSSATNLVLFWDFDGTDGRYVKDRGPLGISGTVIPLGSGSLHQFGVAEHDLAPKRLDFPSGIHDPTNDLYLGSSYFNANSNLFRGYISNSWTTLITEAPLTGAWVRSNGTWVSFGGPYVTGGPYLPLAGGAMAGPVTSSSTWQGTSFTGGQLITTGASAGVQIKGRTQVTNVWEFYTAGQSLFAYYFPGSGGFTAYTFATNGLITSVQGTYWNSGNDGSGSNLDADLLDGYHASSFLQDAPSTGSVYGRSNATWAVVSSGTSYNFTNGLTNSANVVSWAAVPGSNISFATNNGQITISSSTGTTNSGTAVSVDGAATMVAANFADSTELNPTASGSNVTYAIVTASIATNKIDATFHGLLTAADLVGSGTNIFVNAALVSLANLQDDTGAGGINWAVSGSNIKAYATNVAHGLTHTNGLTNSAGVVQWAVSAGTNVTLTTNNGRITIAADASGTSYSFTNGITNSAGVVQWAVAQGANVTLTTNNGQITIAASTGSTNDLYIAKNVTKVSISNTVDETTVYAWTIPADTLNANGDELEFYVPAKYLEYNGQTNGYRWDFYIDRSQPGESATTGDYSSALASISTSFMMDWNVRVKRMSSTEALLIAKHICGADGSGDTTNVITTSRYLEHTIVNGWDQDMDFELTFTPGVTNMNHGIVAYGSTVRKLR